MVCNPRTVFLALFLCCLAFTGCEQQAPPETPKFNPASQDVSLIIEKTGSATRTIPFAELYALSPQLPTVTFDDPLYGEERTYEGLNLEQLRNLANADSEFKVIRLHCRDGFTTEVETKTLESGTFLLCLRDPKASPKRFLDYDQMLYLQTEPGRLKEQIASDSLSDEEKEKLKKKRKHVVTFGRDLKRLRNQGPFYPVFIAPDAPNDEFWTAPFSVDRVTFKKSLTDRSKALPDGLAEEHPVSKGSQMFKQRCATCHAINGIGGEVGPELNYPKSVTEYWTEAGLKQMMKDPTELRDNSRMPSLHLKDKQVENILAYLRWMAANKKLQPGE